MSKPAEDPEVLPGLIDFLERTFPEAPRPLAPNTSLPNSVLDDSLSYLEVVMFLEKEFGLSFEARDLEGAAFETPSAIADLAKRKLRESR